MTFEPPKAAAAALNTTLNRVTRFGATVIKLAALVALVGALCALGAPIGWPFELFGSFPYTFAAIAILAAICAGLSGAPRLSALNLLAGLGLIILALVSVGSLPHAIKPSADITTKRIVWHNVMREHGAVLALSQQISAFNPSIVALAEVRPGLDLKALFPATGAMQGAIQGAYFGVQQSGCIPLTLPVYKDKWWKGRVWGLKAQCDGFTLFAVHLRNPLWRWGERLKVRNAEMDLLRDAIKLTDGPIIVIGDFNTVPSSFALRNFVKEAGVIRIACGGRWKPTWRPKPLIGTKTDPNFWVAAPIDHLLVRDMNVRSCSVGTNTGSDHLPLLIEITPVITQSSPQP